jgi:hypothetical protein
MRPSIRWIPIPTFPNAVAPFMPGAIITTGCAIESGNPVFIAGSLTATAYVMINIYRMAFPHKEITVPIPWTAQPAAIEPPRRQPIAYPPKPGQCFVCGIIDPEREASLGTANHPECVEWLGDWKPPAPPPATNRVSVPYTGITTQEAYAAMRDISNALAAPTKQGYVFTCKCPDCVARWSFLRSCTNGHPTDCGCTACNSVRDARTAIGDHHRNCMCGGGLYCARSRRQKPFAVDGHLTYGGDYSDAEIQAAYDELNARYARNNIKIEAWYPYPDHTDSADCRCAVCSMVNDYAEEIKAKPPIILPATPHHTPVMGLDGHLEFRGMPHPHVLGYTHYPDHFELFEGRCVACQLITDYFAQPQQIKLPPFEPDPKLTKRIKE